MNILTIEELRNRKYQSTPLKIEKTLEEKEEYIAYLASYDSDGLKIYGYLTIPKGEKPESGWPIILFNHGGVDVKVYKVDKQYVRYQDYLAKAGYITFKSDYRGHDKSEGKDENVFESGYTIDVLNAIEAIKQFPQADPNRVGLWGHSRGGNISLKVMEVRDDIKCGVFWAGSVGSYEDVLKRWGKKNTMRQKAKDIIKHFGESKDNPEFWRSISPINYLKYVSAPIQLHHGKKDASISENQSIKLKEGLEKMGKQVELILYETADHNFSGPELKEAMEKSIPFFDKYLK